MHRLYCILFPDPCPLLGFFLLVDELVVDENTAAGFAHDDFFVQGDIQLALGRNLAETTTAGITLNFHDGQAIVRVLADFLESGE